jgi:hypothetical protein
MSDYRPARDISPVVPPPRVMRDLSTYDGAEALCQELNAWWHSRGFTAVRHWAEWRAFARTNGKRSDQLGRSSGTWIVRSNLVNAMPPRQTGDQTS